MKFRFKHEDPKDHAIFDGKSARHGDIIEYDGFFAKKALSDPKHFDLVKEDVSIDPASDNEETDIKSVIASRRGRRKKVGGD